jgi:hypothetical protein
MGDARQALANEVTEAQLIMELMRHPGMVMLKKRIDAEAGKNYRNWALETDRDKAESFRLRAQGYELFFKEAALIVKKGEIAQQQLTNLDRGQKMVAVEERTIIDQPPA